MPTLPPDPQARARNDDFQMVAEYTPPHYPGRMTGPGRWCSIQAPIGHVLGYLWTNNSDGIGFVQVDTSDRGIQFAREVQDGIRAAASVQAPVVQVFDYWSNRVNLAAAAGEIHTGDLDALGAALN